MPVRFKWPDLVGRSYLRRTECRRQVGASKSGPSPMKTATGATVITNGQLIDGTGAAPTPDAAIVIRDGKIAYAGPVRGAPPIEASATRIDARGGTIMPGLIEAHF